MRAMESSETGWKGMEGANQQFQRDVPGVVQGRVARLDCPNKAILVGLFRVQQEVHLLLQPEPSQIGQLSGQVPSAY
jgi:hypothetical protein